MKTIRIKLFLIFLLFMVGFVSCSILLNLLFLERYYISQNKGLFIAQARNVAKQYSNDRNELESLLGEIDRVNNISLMITNQQNEIVVSSFPPRRGLRPTKVPPEIEELIQENINRLEESYLYTAVERRDNPNREIVFIIRLERSGEMLIMRKSIRGINESSAIAIRFFIFSGVFLSLVGGIIIFYFSSKLTRPIIEMSRIAERISNLDFTGRVNIDSPDEIGSLGGSINRIAEKLSSSIDELRNDVERRKLLVRNMSHELKTPIGVIKGYTEGLRFGVAQDRQMAEKYCGIIAAECDRMDGIIRELLHLSLLESGAFELKQTRFNLTKMISSIRERFLPIMEKEQIVLKIQCPAGLMVMADCELIERAVTNFVTNALHYVDEKKTIEITAEKTGVRIRISTFNSGPGISEEEMAKIWDVFYKTDPARTRENTGHGLGLAIVKHIAQLHNGNYGVENVSGGIRFYLEWPQ
jgi:two-component system sensor histidine kinase VanS